MKPKTLALLFILAALLGAGAWWTARHKFAPPPGAVGSRALPGFNVNDAAKIQILAAGTNLVVAKIEGRWTVVSRFNYPAKFDKVVECLRELDGLKIGQVVPVAESRLGAFNLLAPATNAAAGSAGGTGTLLRICDAGNKVLAALIVGKHFMHKPPAGQPPSPMLPGMEGYPDGQYIRVGEDKVFLVARTLDRLMENAKYWLDEEFVNVPAQDIVELTVTGPDRAPIVLRPAKEGEPLALMAGDEREIAADAGKVGQLAGALNRLGFDDVAAPTLTAADTGLDRAIVIKARTRPGQVYTLSLGKTLGNDSFDRYAQVNVACEPPAVEQPPAEGAAAKDAAAQKKEEAKNLAEDTKALNDKLSSWVYTLKSYRVEPLLMKREDLLNKPEPPAAETTPAGAAP